MCKKKKNKRNKEKNEANNSEDSKEKFPDDKDHLDSRIERTSQPRVLCAIEGHSVPEVDKLETASVFIESIRKGCYRALECFTSYLDHLLDMIFIDYYPEDYRVLFLYLGVFLVPFSIGSKLYGGILGPPPWPFR